MKLAQSDEEGYHSYIKKVFRTWSHIYDIVSLPLSIAGIRYRVVELTNVKGSKILDVCTGTGEQAFAFGKRGYDVVGIDLSEDMLKIAIKKNKYKNVRFKLSDATTMQFEDGYFDASCVSFALHDMPLGIREKVLGEMVRVTKPKGMIVIADYALPKNRIGRYLVYHFVKSYETRYYSEFIKSDLETLLRKSGIRVERIVPVMFGTGRIIKGIRV